MSYDRLLVVVAEHTAGCRVDLDTAGCRSTPTKIFPGQALTTRDLSKEALGRERVRVCITSPKRKMLDDLSNRPGPVKRRDHTQAHNALRRAHKNYAHKILRSGGNSSLACLGMYICT